LKASLHMKHEMPRN